MIIVTGMHRSGTSLVTRLLHEAGCDLGAAASLHPGDRWNPDGYFEQRDVLRMNRTLTEGWLRKLAYFRLPNAATVRRRGDEHQAQLAELCRKYDHKLVKDTRFCLTLPAWLDHGLRLQGVIVVLRHPNAIARSLAKRNRLPRRLALNLWATHLWRLLPVLEGRAVRWVRYERLVSSADGLAELARAVRLAGVEPNPEQLHALLEHAVRPEAAAAEERALPPRRQALWDELLRRHAAQGP